MRPPLTRELPAIRPTSPNDTVDVIYFSFLRPPNTPAKRVRLLAKSDPQSPKLRPTNVPKESPSPDTPYPRSAEELLGEHAVETGRENDKQNNKSRPADNYLPSPTSKAASFARKRRSQPRDTAPPL